MDFPMPFGGISVMMELENREQLQAFVSHTLGGCGKDHMHNFAITTDRNGVWGSDLLAECFMEWWNERH